MPKTEESIAALVDAERERLLAKAGLGRAKDHFQRPAERPFPRRERARTTLLFGGLTVKHEELIKAAIEGLGYKVENLPVPDVKAFQLGKEYGNNGQCNPTYFTVGNLVQWLQEKRDAGVDRRTLMEDYLLLTAGACGPCRFGVYEAEYRVALRNAGFDGFRVHIFQQKGGLAQSDIEAGLDLNLDFFLGMASAVVIGDLLNEIGYQMRPYEVVPGATDAALARCTAIMRRSMRERTYWNPRKSRLRFVSRARLEVAGKFASQLVGNHYTDALEECRQVLAGVAVDRTRVCPTVKITGEFWAQTTEGDGNFRMFRFLQGEGAEVLVEPVATWLLYMLWQVKQSYRDRFGLKGERNPLRYLYKRARIAIAERIFTRCYNRARKALGGTAHPPVCQLEMERLGHRYYHSRSQGGEGHMEVAKNIYYASNNLCHMVLSLKPFGCMPSTQSDGAQAAVVSDYPDMIYLPVETSGEGEINAHSRVQMALGEARRRAKEEFKQALEATGRSLAELRAFQESRPGLMSGLTKVPRDRRYAGTAARWVAHLAERMR